jgi:hypothetical protein
MLATQITRNVSLEEAEALLCTIGAVYKHHRHMMRKKMASSVGSEGGLS